MAKTIGPFRDSQALSWLYGPRTDVPTGPSLMGPDDGLGRDERN